MSIESAPCCRKECGNVTTKATAETNCQRCLVQVYCSGRCLELDRSAHAPNCDLSRAQYQVIRLKACVDARDRIDTLALNRETAIRDGRTAMNRAGDIATAYVHDAFCGAIGIETKASHAELSAAHAVLNGVATGESSTDASKAMAARIQALQASAYHHCVARHLQGIVCEIRLDDGSKTAWWMEMPHSAGDGPFIDDFSEEGVFYVDYGDALMDKRTSLVAATTRSTREVPDLLDAATKLLCDVIVATTGTPSRSEENVAPKTPPPSPRKPAASRTKESAH